ncbi:MAG: FUSC family protein [Chlamydiia bacterium]|nr:FUSC family protein [Chlamydiia bacterium]
MKMLLRRIDWRHGLQLGVTSALALMIALSYSQVFDRPTPLLSGLWTVLTAIVVLRGYLGGTYRMAGIRFLGIFVGAIMGGFFTSIVGTYPLSLGICIFLTVILCSLMGLKESIRIACLSVTVVMVLEGLYPDTNPWIFSFYRFFDSVVGILIALLVSNLLLPAKTLKKLKENTAQILSELSDIYRSATAFLSDDFYATTTEVPSRFLFERMQHNRVYIREAKMELLTDAVETEYWTKFLRELEELLEWTSTFREMKYSAIRKILSEDLLASTIKLVATSLGTIQLLIDHLRKGTPLPPMPELQKALDELEYQWQHYTLPEKDLPPHQLEALILFFFDLKKISTQLVSIANCQIELPTNK